MSGPTYTYTADTPQSAQAMNNSQSEILNNFRAINELVNVNHVGFNTTNSGMHSYISMPFPSTVTTPTSTDINMYVAATGSPNACEIFFEGSNTTPVQISDIAIGGTVPAGTSGTGWCEFSTSGLIIKWGTGTITIPDATTGGGAIFYFPTGTDIPAYTYVFGYVKVTPTSIPTGINYGGLATYNNNSTSSNSGSTTYFYIYGTAGVTFTFNWWAIGI
jgi:hypothetical protein